MAVDSCMISNGKTKSSLQETSGKVVNRRSGVRPFVKGSLCFLRLYHLAKSFLVFDWHLLGYLARVRHSQSPLGFGLQTSLQLCELEVISAVPVDTACSMILC